MAKLIEFTNPTLSSSRLSGKRGAVDTVEINGKITRKPPHGDIFIQCVRERIANDWRRGKLSRDLSNVYRGVSRETLERIAHEELFGKKGAA